LLRVVFLTFN